MTGFLDIETGGFSVEKNGVCEISIIAVDDQLTPVEEFHRYIHPYLRPDSDEPVSYKDDAMAINGLTVEKLIDEGMDVTQVMNELREFCAKQGITRLIGHNIPAFDIPRVKYLMERFTDFAFGFPNVECTLKMARDKWSGLASYKQEDLCTMLEIANPNAHSAKGDCYANIELYKILIS